MILSVVIAYAEQPCLPADVGITMREDGPNEPLRIAEISKDGPFANSELEVGMNVLSINHKRATELDIPTAMECLQSGTGKARIGAAHDLPLLGVDAIAQNAPPPPRNVPGGGVWIKRRVYGDAACAIICLCVLCFGRIGYFLIAASEPRDVYSVNGKLYDENGKYVGRDGC